MTSKELRGKADESFLSDRDITQAEELLTVLQPLKVATVAQCEEKVPTVSIILPLQKQLLDHTLALKPDDSEFINSVKRAISDDLSHRYSDDKVKNTLVKSALLDHRFKTGPFIQEGEKCSAFNAMTLETVKLLKGSKIRKTVHDNVTVKQEPDMPEMPDLPNLPDSQCSLQELNESHSDSEHSTKPKVMKKENEASASSSRDCAMSCFFGDVILLKTEEPKSTLAAVEDEIVCYKKIEAIPLQMNRLDWWRGHQAEMPFISRLAKKYLTIPATSVPSERVFSTARDIITAQRSALCSERVDKLIFLKKNWHLRQTKKWDSCA